MLTSQDDLSELAHPAYRMMKLHGLSELDAPHFLRVLGVEGSDAELRSLSGRYAGIPQALVIVAPIIVTDPIYRARAAEFLADRSWALTGDLEQLVNQSLSRLSPLEAECLKKISVFEPKRYPVTIAAIAAQMPFLSKYQVYDLVQALRRRNLLQQGPGTIDYELQPFIQERLLRELDASEGDKVRAHKNAFDFLRSIPLKPSTDWTGVSDLASALEAIRHAYKAEDWLGALDITCDERIRRSLVRWGEHRRILETFGPIRNAPHQIDAVVADEHRAFRAIALNLVGIAFRNLKRHAEAIEAFEQGLEESKGDAKWQSIIYENLALACIDNGALSRAIESADAALRLARASGDRRAESYALGNLGIAWFRQGQLSEARAVLCNDIRICLKDGQNDEGLAHAFGVLGQILRAEGDRGPAMGILATSVQMFRRLHNSFREVEFLSEIGELLLEQQDYFRAAICLRRCGALAQSTVSELEATKFVEAYEKAIEEVDQVSRQSLTAMSDHEVDQAVSNLLSLNAMPEDEIVASQCVPTAQH